MIEVFHLKNTRDSWEIARQDVVSLKLYDPAAVVQVDKLEKAYELTNNIWQAWTENDGVKCLTAFPRSTSVGDVMRQDGKYYMVKHVGFAEVKVN
jgi:hypothetical protein